MLQDKAAATTTQSSSVCDGINGRTPAQCALIGALKQFQCVKMFPVAVLEMFADYAACTWNFCIAAAVPYKDAANNQRKVTSMPLIGGGLSMCVAIVDVTTGVPAVAPVGRLTAQSAQRGMMVRTRTHVCIVPSNSKEPMSILDTTAKDSKWQEVHSPVEPDKYQRAYVRDDSVCVTDIAANVRYLLDVGNQSYTPPTTPRRLPTIGLGESPRVLHC